MKAKKEEPYREGCDETVPQEQEKVETQDDSEGEVVDLPQKKEDPVEETGAQEEPKMVPIPDTAFLVLRHSDGRIEAVTNLPGINTSRVADLRDIRDISHSLFMDVSTTIYGKVTAREAASSLQQAVLKQQINKMAGAMKKH